MKEKIRLEAKITGNHTIPFHKDGLTIYLEPSELISQLREQGYSIYESCNKGKLLITPPPTQKIEEIPEFSSRPDWMYEIRSKINEIIKVVNER